MHLHALTRPARQSATATTTTAAATHDPLLPRSDEPSVGRFAKESGIQ